MRYRMSLDPFLVLVVWIQLVSGGLSQTVVVLKDKDITPYNKAISGIKEACKVRVEILDLDRAEKENKDLKSEVLAYSPTAMVTVGRSSLDWAAKHLKDMPVVYCMNPDPDLSFAGQTNTVGIDLQVPPKVQFDALKKMFSKAQAIGIIYIHDSLDSLVQRGGRDAQAAGLKYLAKKIDEPGKMGAALKEIVEEINVIWVLPDKDLISPENARLLILMSVDYGIPLLVYSSDFVKKGALLGIYPDFEDTGRKAGLLLNGILGGATPNALVPETPETLWAINLNMAKRLNITVPDAIKLKAEVLIE